MQPDIQTKTPLLQSRLAWFTKTVIEPKLPGASRVVPLLDPLLAQFSDVNPFYVRDVARLWAQLQRICKRPYIPWFEEDWILSLEEGSELINNASRYFLFAALIYPPNHIGPFKVAQGLRSCEGMDIMLKRTIPGIEVIAMQKDTSGPVPAHLIAVHHTFKEIIVAVRGSAEAADWVINLVCHLSPEGFHEGMHEAAKALQHNIEQILDNLVSKHPLYSIVLTGHSMGAGVSCLVAWDFKVKGKFEGKVKAVTFASPVVVHPDLLPAVEADITNFVLGRDIVCHGGFRAIQIYTRMLSEMASMLAMSRPTLICRLREDSGGLLQLGNVEGDSESDSSDSSSSADSPNTHLSPMRPLTITRAESNPSLLTASTSPESPPAAGVVCPQKGVSLHFPIALHDLCALADTRIEEMTKNGGGASFLRTFIAFSFGSFPTWTSPVPPPQDIFDESLETIEEQWKYLSKVLGPAPCIPGRIIHVIPRDHLQTYDHQYSGNQFINDCLFVNLPPERTKSWCEECNLTIEAIFDHLIESYALAFAKDSLLQAQDQKT